VAVLVNSSDSYTLLGTLPRWKEPADTESVIRALRQSSLGCLKAPASHWCTRALVAPSKADVSGSAPPLFS
jgi:hypothetical protein